MKRNKFKSILRHLTSEDIDKKINNLHEKMGTSGMYDVRSLDSGTPATPDTPAVPPTYADVDPGGIAHPDEFSWPDQGDGSDPNAAPVIPPNLLTTYDGNQIGAMRTLDTYNGQPIDYGGEPPIGTLVTRGGWLNWDYIGYLSGSGVQIVGTTVSTTTDLARAIYNAWTNWPYPGRVQKTIYQWGPLDCLLGTCRSAIQYYPPGSSNTTLPRAERALYSYQLWIPTDENGNVLRNRVQTDPGSPLIPGDPAIPPKLVTMSRDNLGDPNYYPGPIEPQIQDQLKVGKRGYDYLNQASGGDEEEEEFGPGRERGFRLPGMFAGTQSDQKQAETQPTQQEPAEQELTSADFSNYSDYRAFKDGGGNAAVKQGKTLQQVIDQGKKNQSAASPSQQSDDSQFGPGKGRGFKLPGFGTPQQSDSGYSGPTGYQYAKAATNVAGGTAFNPSLRAIGSQGKGLGGEIKVGQHGTGPEAAKSIKKGGFRAGSRQNVYGTKGVFLDPSRSQAAADEFARAGAAAEAGGRGTAGRTAAQRAADLKAAGSAGKGTKIPVAYKPGTGARMNLPGTKYAEVGVDASKATKGMRLMQNAATKYPNSAKAAQLLRTGGTTAKLGLARTAASKLGRAVPFAGAALSVADAAVRVSQGDYAGAIMSGLSAIPGPVGWAALGAQLVYDASRSMKEEVEYNDYNEYLANVREVAKQKGIKFDNNSIDLLRNELALNDKLDDEDKEYLVDIFDNPDNVNPDEMSEFIQRIVSKLSSEGEQVSESVVLSEGWQSPDHVNVERDPKKRWFNPTAGTNSKYWFDPNDIAPDYPNNPPPEMVDGYSSKSNLAPKSLDQTNPFITITKKDLTRNHRLKDSEIAEMMDTINRINAFLAAHPEELVYAQRRYPKGDPRLAELNWKHDQMMRASNQYMETHFPENEKLFTKLKATIDRNIQLTDPSTFKYTPDPVTHNQVTEEVKPRRSISKYMKKYEKKPNRSFLKKKKK